jgi:predicted transcriptional regulator
MKDPQNMNNRLKILADSGALQRFRSTIPGGGREFVYRLPPAAHQAPAVA